MTNHEPMPMGAYFQDAARAMGVSVNGASLRALIEDLIVRTRGMMCILSS